MRHLLFFAWIGWIGSMLITERNRSHELVWSDEFERDGKPDSIKWYYEHGFVRNEELQWYQTENARLKKECLLLSQEKNKN